MSGEGACAEASARSASLPTTRSDLLKKLAQEIFQKPLMMLKKRETAFIGKQFSQFLRYRTEIRIRALEAMGKGKLSTRDYNIIERWFFQNVPLACVLRGMRACLRNAEASGKAVYSLAFFRPHVAAEFRLFVRRMTGSNFFHDPWGYREFLQSKNKSAEAE